MTRRTLRSFVSAVLLRRAVAFFVVAALLGAPAAAMRVLCVGNSCDARAEASSNTPFCSLPRGVRTAIARGFYEGRSPDLMAVTGPSPVQGGSGFSDGEHLPLWPSAASTSSDRVPVVFSGRGVNEEGEVASGAGLEDVAPTLASIIDLRRPHPGVRSGEAISGVATGETPRLLLQVIWKGVGSKDLEAEPSEWPTLRALIDQGAGTLDGSVGSLPLDPAAALATIGTGGTPSQHGVVGTLARSGFDGRLVPSWGRGFGVSVIATLGDHLDERLRQEPEIGLVGTDVVDRGVVGGNWYLSGDKDVIRILPASTTPADQATEVVRLLEAARFGKDETPDLLAFVASGSSVQELDRALAVVIRAAERVSDGSAAISVAGTGSADEAPGVSISAREIEQRVERGVTGRTRVVDATAPGGLFLDQEALARLKLSEDEILQELLDLRTADGRQLMADAFPAIAVSFGRYC